VHVNKTFEFKTKRIIEGNDNSIYGKLFIIELFLRVRREGKEIFFIN